MLFLHQRLFKVIALSQVSAIDELTQRKKNELLDEICRLSDAQGKAQRGMDLLERRIATSTDLRQTVVGDEVQKTQTSLRDLEDLLAEIGR